MLLQLIVHISLLLSSLFLISQYITKHKRPLNHHSSLSDKLLIGFFYGLSGSCLMYANKELSGNVADLRQVVLLLSFFYGGWVPALVSFVLIVIFRLVLFGLSSISIVVLSLITTLTIAQIGVKLPVSESKQWYLITAGALLEIYTVLWFHSTHTSFFDPELLHFAFAFILGMIFSYHFTEFLRHSYKVTEELRQSKERLERSEADYRLIAEHSSDLIAVLSIEGNALYLSPSHLPVVGLLPEAYTGKSMGALIHPEDYPQVKHHWKEAIKKKREARTEYRYQRVDGRWVWIETHYVPVLGIVGNVDKLVAISRDVTERKQTEEFYRDREKLFVVGELAAGIAHEIRNPLTTLKGFIQMMKKESSPSHFLDIMYEEMNRIEFITNELLYLAKPQAQEIKKTNIKEMLEQVTTLFYPQAVFHNILLTLKCEEDFPRVTCVESHLKQVFINLLKNAIEAMPDSGEIILEAKKEEEGFLLISVKDQGAGIPEDRIEKLGQPFYSLKDKGTGLGLTICKKIIQEHNGSMMFQSTEGVGTTVEVRLPIT